MRGTGLRVMEFVNLKKEAITFTGDAKGRISVIGKGAKPRYTTMTHALTDKIKEYSEDMNPEDALFPRKDGQLYTSGW